MQLTDDRILVESRERAALFIFDRGGNLQNVIREYGEGPGEFVLIDELYVRDNRICIHSYALKKWLTFNFEGNFLEEGKIPTSFNKSYIDKDFNLYFFQRGHKEEKWTFMREADEKDTSYLPLKKGYESFISKGDPWGFNFDSFRDKLYFVEPHTYNIQVFDKNGYWKDSISFNFGQYNFDTQKRLSLAKDYREMQNYLQNNPKVENMTTFYGFENFLITSYNIPGQGNQTLFLDNDHSVISIVKEWENDMDGMIVYNALWAFTKKEVIYHLNSRTFYRDYVKTFSGKQVKINPGNVHDFFDRNKEKLKDEKLVLVVLKVK